MTQSGRNSPRKILSRALVVVGLFLSATTAVAVPGIDSRPSNLTCAAPDRPNTGPVILGQAFPDVPTVAGFRGIGTLTVEFPPGDSTHLYLMDRDGQISRFVNDVSTSQTSVVLDLRPLFAGTSQVGQSGMMDMAFHPHFASNGELYVSYTVPSSNRTSYLARYTSADGGASFSSAGEILLSLPQDSDFHNIGAVFFGQDGYLYVSFGDGGHRDLVQDTFEWYGKILRIDVDSGTPYGIPSDNPYAAGGGAPEVFALGLRNPWRFSEDKVTGEIWAGDVGASDWEEVDKIVKGGNYGWPIREGAHCRTAGCDPTGLIDPV